MRIHEMILKNVAVVGDVHSCSNLLQEIVDKVHAHGVDQFIFVGDLLDRGSDPVGTVKIISDLVANGSKVIVGNHDWKIIRHFRGNKVKFNEEAQASVDALNDADMIDTFGALFDNFQDPIFAIVDNKNKIVINHAGGIKPAKLVDRISEDGTISRKTADRMLYGMVDGFSDDGFPNRLPLTTCPDDDLDGWIMIHGHIHSKGDFFPEGNPNVICVDQSAGKGDGRIGAWIIHDDVRTGIGIMSDSTA